MTSPVDASTIRFRSPLAAHRPDRALALTIVWHPDYCRIGERARLESETAVSRKQPAFRARGNAVSIPLADAGVSGKRASFVLRPGNGEVILDAPLPGEVEVNGVLAHSAMTLTSADIDRGVIITVSERVVLCLHRMIVPEYTGQTFGLVGDSDELDAVRQAIQDVADSDLSVLIRGETGTGKELVARGIVACSSRTEAPFVVRNFAAIPTSTAAAELFGHEKGAFTGATHARGGAFVDADGGTLFLDEIALAPAEVQALLLRVLETRDVQPLGGRPRHVDVRIISATDAPLEDAVKSGAFSEPLFHRLAGYQISLPPLSQHRQDIGSLLVHFLRQALITTHELDRLDPRPAEQQPWLPAPVVAQLCLAPWPGNVRELRNIANHIVISSRGRAHAVIDQVVARTSRPESSLITDVLDSDRVLAALSRNQWQAAGAARELGVSRKALTAWVRGLASLPSVSDFPDDEFLKAFGDCQGDLSRMSATLHISRRAAKLRLTKLLRLMKLLHQPT